MLVNILSNFAAVLIGGVITWLVARYFYQKAGDELMAEAAGLRRLTEIMLHAMEDAGIVKLYRDKNIEITGRIIDARKPRERDAIFAPGDVIQYHDKYVQYMPKKPERSKPDGPQISAQFKLPKSSPSNKE